MAKVEITANDLIRLLERSKIAGIQNKAIDLAIEWLTGLDEKIAKLTNRND